MAFARNSGRLQAWDEAIYRGLLDEFLLQHFTHACRLVYFRQKFFLAFHSGPIQHEGLQTTLTLVLAVSVGSCLLSRR